MGAFIDVSIQVGVLFLLMGVGFACSRLGYLKDSAVKGLSEFVLNFVAPCVILNAFALELSGANTRNLLIAAASAFGGMGTAIVLFRLGFFALSAAAGKGRSKDAAHPPAPSNKPLIEFASVYSNCGFMGLPLLNALLGAEGVLYGAVYIIAFNLLIFTHGAMLLSGERFSARSLGRALCSPAVLSVGVAFGLYALGIRLPSLFTMTIEHIAAINTPLPMIIIGARIASSDLKRLFSDRLLLPPALMRNILIPLGVLGALLLLGVRGPLLSGCVLPAAMPVAGNTVIFTEKYGGDAEFAAGVLTLSTLLSLVTIPLIATLAMTF